MDRLRLRRIAIASLLIISASAAVFFAPARRARTDSAVGEQGSETRRIPAGGPDTEEDVAFASRVQDAPQPASDWELGGLDVVSVLDDGESDLLPIGWTRPRFSGKPEEFTPEDFTKARTILDRYFGNFSRIGSISFRHEKKTSALEDNDFTRKFLRVRKAVDNWTVDVEITRSPLYFRMEGALGDGRSIKEIVTPAGKISSGFFRSGESNIPVYLEGEELFSEALLLKHGDRIERARTMDLELPGLEDSVARAWQDRTQYDVIVLYQDAPPKLRRDFWFSRDTGMVEFVVAWLDVPDPKDRSLYDATAVTYCRAGDVLYPRRTVRYLRDYQLLHEEDVHDLVINGVPASGS